MKKHYEIVKLTQVRGKWWRVDYVNAEGKMEFETVEALDSNEAFQLCNNILHKRFSLKPKKSSN
jgi:hypothetical protein